MNHYFKGFLLFLIFSISFVTTNLMGQEKLTLQNFSAIPNNSNVHHIARRGSSLYISTDKGLYKLNTTNNIVTEYYNHKDIQYICFLTKNKFIVANEHRILDQEANILYKFKQGVAIYQIIPFDKSIWVSTSNGIYTFTNNGKYTVKDHYTKENSKLTTNNIKNIYLDKTKRLWIAMTPGLISVRKGKWKAIRDFKKENIISLTSSDVGIWALTENDLEFTHFNGRGSSIGLKNGLKRGKVTNVSANSKGKIYIASNILVGLDPFTDQSNTLDKGIELLSKQITTSAFDQTDKLWVGTKQSGLFVMTIEEIKVNKNKKSKNKFKKNIEEQSRPPLTSFILVKDDFGSCNSSSGSLEVQADGGRSPYRFHWSTGSQENIIKNLVSGTYTVTITDSAGEKTESIFNSIGPASITISILEKKDLTSNNAINGYVSIDISGVTKGYEIFWDEIKGKNINRKLSEGNHTVTVIDNSGCKGELSFEIKAPKILEHLDIKELEVGKTLAIKKLHFDADSTFVKEESFEVLAEIYKFLTDNPSVKVEIGGHTNNIPTHAYCNKLSTARAKHIAEHLIARGLDIERIQYKGYGKTMPVASNKTSSGRKRNQRVELKILSL